MNRNPLYAVVAFAVLGLIAVFALRQPEKGETARDRARPIEKLDPAALDTLVVTRGGATTTIKKDGAKYSVTAPVAYPADEAVAKAGFEALTGLELTDLVTENKAKQAEFEVDDAKAIHVVAKSAKNGDKILADIMVGKNVGNGTMVRLAGKDEIWKAGAGLRPSVDKGPADWRDKSVVTFPLADAEIVTVKAKDGTVAIAKKNGKTASNEDRWDLVSSTPKIDKVDNSVPNGIVNALSSFKANDFADGAKPADTGLDAPALTVIVAVKGGKNHTLLIGNKKGDEDWYVKNADAPQVYTAKKFNVERINKRPIEFKDKVLCDLAESDLAEVAVTNGADSFTLTHAGSEWKATKPAKLTVDPGKTPSIAGGFKDWKATSFAEDTAPAATGLAKPRATIVAKPKSTKAGDACSFKVGDETKDKQSVYVSSAKGPDVYLAPKWSIDRLLVKVDDLKKK
jgi:hypothetical protein